MSNLAKTFTVLALLYFGVHLTTGYFYCQENFCPGDSETDWVYEYEDDDGKKFIVVEGKTFPKEQYQRNSTSAYRQGN